MLVAPAVWGRAEMNVFMRAALWLVANTMPGLTTTGSLAARVASDNRAAIRRLSTDPLTIHDTRFDTDPRAGRSDGCRAGRRAPLPRPGTVPVRRQGRTDPGSGHRGHLARAAAGSRAGILPADYHLLLRDMGRGMPIDDILAWICRPGDPLPSGADRAAAVWLAKQGK